MLFRSFPTVTLKGSELPEGHPGRKWKGRVVFQGNNITDQSSDLAVIQDMASSSALMSAGKLIDTVATTPGHAGMQCDAQQAYTQSRLGGNETWVFLPRDQWPPEWSKYRQPVVRLDLALYGHPLR